MGGGLTWSLATRSNETWGTTEIWQARAASKLTNAVVTAKLAGAFDGSIMVATFKGAATTVGAVGAASGKKGAPAVKVSPKYCGSLVWATGHDWSAAQDPKPAAGQSIVHKFIDRRVKDSYWFQKVDAPTATGVPVTVSATGFVTDRWTYVAVEIPRIAG